jgi:serine/threonine-protein kinase HipA
MSKTKFRDSCVVFVYLPGQTQAVPAGLLTITESGRDISSTFAYGNKYRQRDDALSLDPIELPLPDRATPDSLLTAMKPKDGKPLFGVFRDSAPDAWGRLVINDAYLSQRHLDDKASANAIDLPEMEYLLRSHKDRVGNLDFRLTDKSEEPPEKSMYSLNHKLEQLLKEANRLAQNKKPSVYAEHLMAPHTGLGGARPKITLKYEEELWLAKFPLLEDRLPVTRIEFAMLSLARQCGIETIETRLLDMPHSKDPLFLIKRFDRIRVPGQKDLRLGYSSALTTLGSDEQTMSHASYQDIASHIRRFGEAQSQAQDRTQVFKRMVFNALSNNDDDHLRNHGFLRMKGGTYKLSPVFDLVPRALRSGVSTERRLAIRLGMYGREVNLDNILSDLAPFNLEKGEAVEILIDMAQTFLKSWPDALREAGCNDDVISGLSYTLNYGEYLLEQIEQMNTIESERLAREH